MHKSISGFPGPSENNGGTDFFTKAFRGIALQMCKYYLIFLNFQWWTTFSINQTYNYFHTMLVFLLYRLQEMIRFVWNASRTSCVSSTTSGVDCGLTTTRNYGCTYSFFFFWVSATSNKHVVINYNLVIIVFKSNIWKILFVQCQKYLLSSQCMSNSMFICI